MMSVILGVVVGFASYTDIRKSIIPNYLTISSVIIGLTVQSLLDGTDGLLRSFLGLAAGFSLMLLLYLFGALGAGDVKLFAGIGALTSVSFVINTMIYALLFAGIIGFGMLIFRKQLFCRLFQLFQRLWLVVWLRDLSFVRNIRESEHITFPFMLAAAPGVILAYFEHGL